MDLHSNNPYWLLKHGIIDAYPSLKENITTEVVIIGAGISGSLTAWYLCKAGFDVTIVDRRHVGMGSTVASTSLLQYEIDIPLFKLIKKMGRQNAINSYLKAKDAIYMVRAVCNDLGDKTLCVEKPSLQFASYKKDVNDLWKEYQMRKEIGFEIEWLDGKELFDKFGMTKPAGILSADGADADAYKITHLILEKYKKKRMKIYDHTEVIKIISNKRSIELITRDNKKIKAKCLVIACGYESQKYLPKKVEYLQTTFAIASEPLPQKEFWYKNAIIWETAKPYLYLRTTNDNRIIVGGKDVPFISSAKRDKLLPIKRKALEKSFRNLFPSILFKTDFSWAGIFASTKDGLPYIGSIPQRPNTFYALGFGGNGVLFSAIAAEIIRDALIGRKSPYKDIFSFDR